jgi:hypothetical protein
MVLASAAKVGEAPPPEKEPDGAMVDAALRRAGLNTKGTIWERAARLQEHYEREASILANCSVCGFASPEALPSCAFCGHDAPVKGAEGEALAEVEAPPVDVLADPATAERKLDAALLRYRASVREMVGAGWDVGNAAREIHEHRLYLARRDAKGVPVHRNFAEFCAKELGKSSVHVLRMIEVAQAYSRDEAVRIGEGKLAILLRMTDEKARARLLPMAEAATHREVSEAVRETLALGEGGAPREADRRGRKLGPQMKPRMEDELPNTRAEEYPPPTKMGDPARPQDAKPAPTKGKKADPAKSGQSWIRGSQPKSDPPPAVEARRLTAMVEEGEHQILFYARRKTPGAKLRARTLGDHPKARFRALNGVEFTIALHQGEKGLYGKVQVREVKE